MKEIKLTRGKFALVDDDDYEELSKYSWCCLKMGYAVRNIVITRGKQRMIYMHRAIMKTPEGMDVDHIDGNGLNNQKYNLRNCTHSENGANHKYEPYGISGFYGVGWSNKDRKWRARIEVGGRQITIGYFNDLVDAARARDAFAISARGEFATLNFPDKGNNHDI